MLSTLTDVAAANRAVLSPDAGTLVVWAADLRVRAAETVTAGAAVPASGELAVFCRPVVMMAVAVARRDGGMLAGGWARRWKRPAERREQRRLMPYPLVIRLMIAMALMPDASYCESLARLTGLLADVPFARAWHVPTEKVVTGLAGPGARRCDEAPVLGDGRAAGR